MKLYAAAAAAAKSLQSCPTLCNPIDGSPPGSPIPGILQARTLKWVAISFSNSWKWKVKVKSLSRVQLLDPMDRSPPGSSVHGIFQAKGLEWVNHRHLEVNEQEPDTNPFPKPTSPTVKASSHYPKVLLLYRKHFSFFKRQCIFKK